MNLTFNYCHEKEIIDIMQRMQKIQIQRANEGITYIILYVHTYVHHLDNNNGAFSELCHRCMQFILLLISRN